MIINNNGLTAQDIRSAVPSVYAEAAHESRSKRYLYIPTGDILEGLAHEGFIPTSVMVARSKSEDRKAFTKHLIRLRRRDDLGNPSLDVHEVVMVNSHDGSSAYQLMSGIFRMVCSNGCIVGNMDDTYKVMHRGNIMDAVIEGTYKVVEGSARVMQTVEEMKGIELSRSERLLLSEYTMKARFETDEEAQENGTQALIPYQPADFLRIHRWDDKPEQDGAQDLYTTYQVLQENHIKGHVSRRDNKGQKHTTREIKGIDQNVRVNKLLWQFAEEMKKLKS
jgi:hypothetical protein